MQRWLNVTVTLAFFAAGLILGRSGALVGSAEARPAPLEEASEKASGEASEEASAGSLAWEQEGEVLKIIVTDAAGHYFGIADLADSSAWPELGSENAAILYGRGEVKLDLSGVEAITFYRLEPVGTLQNRVFRPCGGPLAECFPTRPPVDPPIPDLRRHLSMIHDGASGL